MDLKNLFSKKKKEGGADEPKTIKDYLALIIAISILIIFVAVYFFVIRPVFKEQQSMIKDKYEKLEEIEEKKNQMNNLTDKVKELAMQKFAEVGLEVDE